MRAVWYEDVKKELNSQKKHTIITTYAMRV